MVQTNPKLPADRAAVHRTIKTACGTPTQWTKEQKIVVGNYIEANYKEPGLGLLTVEWDRLDRQVRRCRGELK